MKLSGQRRSRSFVSLPIKDKTEGSLNSRKRRFRLSRSKSRSRFWRLSLFQPEPVQPEAESIVGGKVPEAVIKLIADSVSDIADEDGYAFMGELGNLLLKKQPDFDPRNFGFKKLTTLIRSIGRFDIDVRQTGDSNIKHIYLRDKES